MTTRTSYRFAIIAAILMIFTAPFAIGQVTQEEMDKAFEEYDKQNGIEKSEGDSQWFIQADEEATKQAETEATEAVEVAQPAPKKPENSNKLEQVLKDNKKPAKNAIPSKPVSADQADDKVKTAEIYVEGVCKMCKERIENAALIKGVKFAEWNQENNMLKLVYRSDKTNLDLVHSSLAKAGHRTDRQEANEEAYKRLPGCCAYDDGVEKH